MAHKTIVLTTELREPRFIFCLQQTQEHAAKRREYFRFSRQGYARSSMPLPAYTLAALQHMLPRTHGPRTFWLSAVRFEPLSYKT